MQSYLNKENLTSLITTCISVISSLFLTPILSSLALIIYSIRLFISIYLKIFYRKHKLKLIESMDSFQVHDKPNNTLETYITLVLEGEAEIEKIRKAVTERVINHRENLYEKLKCRVCKKYGFYCWENLDEDFEIKKHVKLIEDSNCDKCENNIKSSWTEAQVLQKLADMYSSPMSNDLPRWELVVIPNYVYDDSTSTTEDKITNYNLLNSKSPMNNTTHYAIIFRAHHSIMDGISSYLVLTHTFADFPVETAIDPLKPLNIPCHLQLLKYLQLFIFWPKIFYENIDTKVETNCFHGPELTGPKVTALTKHIPFESITRIRKLTETSTASVLTAAVGGCFKQLAIAKGLPVPEYFTAVTSIPMLPYPDTKPRNRFSGAFFPLVIGKQVSSLERVQSTYHTFKRIKESPLIVMNSLLLRFIGILPAFMSRNMTDSRELTCLTSNVPGPIRETFLFGGNKLVDVSGWVPIKNKTGFGVCFVSYCGQLRASFVADNSIASQNDVRRLAEMFENEIEGMESELDKLDSGENNV